MIFFAALANVLCSASHCRAETPPNIIVILADDLGRGDYSAFGTPDIRTPHIDRLFREGMTFDNFYANSPVCSPTRAALLTGCYPDRVGVPGVIRDIPANSWGYLAPQSVLLPNRLKDAGYHSAIVGKWHLGFDAPNTPLDRGFDFFHGFLGDMMDDYWSHLRNGKNFLRRDHETIVAEGHATDLFTTWACDYLKTRAEKPEPFFLYLAYNAPHDPIQPPPESLQKVKKREPAITEPRAKLVALIEHMDAGIGQVLELLDRLMLTENTMVVFTSDNGGLLSRQARNGPYRSEKQHMYEGGLRVPGAVRWPKKVAAGSRTDRIVVTMDLFPTICEAAGVVVPLELDSATFFATLRGVVQPDEPRDLYFVRREGGPAYGGKTIEALRRGDWKLVQDSPFGPRELFNLKRDPQETTDLAKSEPEVFRALSAALQAQMQRAGNVPWQARDLTSPP